jgi:squalene-hopene/tetraprenyl-beta-curcumene cyclase
MTPDVALGARIERARAIATEALLKARAPGGSWTGELSASALSTATAITALTIVANSDNAAAARLHEKIQRGSDWLIANQNADGGWGDTTNSLSNISTTTLVWAALGLIGSRGADLPVRQAQGREPIERLRPSGSEQRAQQVCAPTAASITAAEGWLVRAAGSLEPDQLVRAIEARYGADRTFSIPILTMCALCGRLGPEHEAWGRVRQLPFEVAALPQRWFGALQLPVVSYALPALIAIGQVRHGKRPTRNPLMRALRNRCRARTLEKLIQLQPANGGFLEATPLTSFVTMSLAAIGLGEHVVVQRGVSFLEQSMRQDGSWPIDTNLATWVTTLSVNALFPAVAASASERKFNHSLALAATNDRDAIREWLVLQQYRHEHPYTLAAPGGWAWTDLPGGVPDADDTAGALLALHRLDRENPNVREAAVAGVTWLLDLQNRDGGIPTFCRGWGKLPFDRSSPDITAHAIRAWIVWRPDCPPLVQRRIDRAIRRAALFLEKTQRSHGAWIPLWFGHQHDSAEENPVYGTSRVILALTCVEGMEKPCERAVSWLVAHQNTDGGWSGAKGAKSSMEETGLAVEALAETSSRTPAEAITRTAIDRGAAWLVDAVEQGRWREPAPIGFYFAKLWYHERLYPLIFATGALTKLRSM